MLQSWSGSTSWCSLALGAASLNIWSDLWHSWHVCQFEWFTEGSCAYPSLYTRCRCACVCVCVCVRARAQQIPMRNILIACVKHVWNYTSQTACSCTLLPVNWFLANMRYPAEKSMATRRAAEGKLRGWVKIVRIHLQPVTVRDCEIKIWFFNVASMLLAPCSLLSNYPGQAAQYFWSSAHSLWSKHGKQTHFRNHHPSPNPESASLTATNAHNCFCHGFFSGASATETTALFWLIQNNGSGYVANSSHTVIPLVFTHATPWLKRTGFLNRITQWPLWSLWPLWPLCPFISSRIWTPHAVRIP